MSVFIRLDIFSIIKYLLSSSFISIIIIVGAYLKTLVVSDISHRFGIRGITICKKRVPSQLLQNLQLGPLYILQSPLYLLSTHTPVRCHFISIYSTVIYLILIIFTYIFSSIPIQISLIIPLLNYLAYAYFTNSDYLFIYIFN